MVESEEVVEAGEAIKSSAVNINSNDFMEVMQSLIDNGVPPAEAGFYAANELSDATQKELGKVFNVTRSSIGSSASSMRNTIRNAKHQFIHFVDGPKTILEHIRMDNGTDTKTHHYIVRYHTENVDAHPDRTAQPDAEYGVIKFKYTGKYSHPQSFESFTIDRYGDINDLHENYYSETLFGSVTDSYAVWETLVNGEGAETQPTPEQQLTHEAEANMKIVDGVLYDFYEITSDFGKMEGWDGVIEYDGEIVDVVSGRDGIGSYSVRARSGAEISHYTDREVAPYNATLYKEVGTMPGL